MFDRAVAVDDVLYRSVELLGSEFAELLFQSGPEPVGRPRQHDGHPRGRRPVLRGGLDAVEVRHLHVVGCEVERVGEELGDDGPVTLSLRVGREERLDAPVVSNAPPQVFGEFCHVLA